VRLRWRLIDVGGSFDDIGGGVFDDSVDDFLDDIGGISGGVGVHGGIDRGMRDLEFA